MRDSSSGFPDTNTLRKPFLTVEALELTPYRTSTIKADKPCSSGFSALMLCALTRPSGDEPSLAGYSSLQ